MILQVERKSLLLKALTNQISNHIAMSNNHLVSVANAQKTSAILQGFWYLATTKEVPGGLGTNDNPSENHLRILSLRMFLPIFLGGHKNLRETKILRKKKWAAENSSHVFKVKVSAPF